MLRGTKPAGGVCVVGHAKARVRQRGFWEDSVELVRAFDTNCEEGGALTPADTHRGFKGLERLIAASQRLTGASAVINDREVATLYRPCPAALGTYPTAPSGAAGADVARSRQPTVRRVPLGAVSAIRSGFVPSAADARERKRQEDEERRRPRTAGLEGAAPERALGLQPGAIQPDGTIAWADLVTMLPVRGGERYTIREGELLLPLRSQRIQTVIARDVPPGVLAAGQWALLAPDQDLADAEYLAWYLNHPRTRARLAGTMMGTSLQFLTIATVRDFEVELPDLMTQRRIGRVAALTARVGRIERRLATARQELADALAMAALDTIAAGSRG